MSRAWLEFQASDRKSQDLFNLAASVMKKIELGYLSPYIRDVVLEEGVSPLGDNVKSYLKTLPPTSQKGSK